MKARIITAIALMALFSTSINLKAFEIDSASGDGEISWTDTNTNGHYRVEWSSDLQTNWSSDWTALNMIAATGGSMTSSIPIFFRVVHIPLQSPASDLRLVQSGGQTDGPMYNFYASKYEVTESQYALFLNDAQKYFDSERGTNMFYDIYGSVFMNDSYNSSEVLFNISYSRLVYDRNAPPGFRYLVQTESGNHPITGVSWYGALKYCNWLTIATGQGAPQRCFREGNQSSDWRPVNLTQEEWEDGFTQLERQNWLDNYRGFRLPMDQSTNNASAFNEFYKMAAWNGLSNTLYGFGRNQLTPHDANYYSSSDPFENNSIKTTPVGYYDGTDHNEEFYTRSNLNYYGIFDLSGNVREWMVDKYEPSYGPYPQYSVRGGSWAYLWSSMADLINTNMTWSYPYEVDQYTGFRIVTTTP